VGSTTSSSVHEVMATEPVIRRVVAARIRNPDDVDDLVQDCLERLLTARDRLAPETVLPFGIVTAQNLVISQARTVSRHGSATHRLVDRSEPARPDDHVLAGEDRTAMAAALAKLTPQERLDVTRYHDDGSRALAGGQEESPGALRVRMARTRAKLRLEYLLAFRHVELPTPQCKRVLLAISGGDVRRQQALGAGAHLLDCPTCASLHEPLAKRSLALTALTFPVALAAWVGGKARQYPAPATAATAVVAAAAVAATALPHSRPPVSRSSAPRARSAPPAAVPVATGHPVSGLTRSGVVVQAGPSLAHAVGQRVDAADVTVQQVVTHNGFWVGPSPTARVWVELVGPLRALHIVTGDHLRFTGTIAANGGAYAAHVGVTAADGAALLTAEGAHIAAATTALQVRP
jgi:RNA polymerase sigma factor (sigma-70 family)